MTINQNISNVVRQKLCNTCGGCFGVCPTTAIHYEETIGGYYLPVVDEEACTHCGLCYEVCPGIHFGNTLTAQMPDDPFGGRALETFVGKATDKKLFDNSQSGGIASALLVHALETGRIKGAVTILMEAGIPPRPVVRIARSSAEIFQSQKSKYCPVPLLGFLRDLKKEDGPVAVACLPCQMHGLRNILDKMPNLGSKISFTVGLVCERVMTYAAMDYLIAQSGLDRNVSHLLHFKDKSVTGYPGDVHVFSSDDKSVLIPASVRKGIKDFFTPARCRICFDKMNVFSDITVGDPYGIAGADRKFGESMLVSRTKIGEEIVQTARTDAAIDLRAVDYNQVLKGQGIGKKRLRWRGYIEAWGQLGRELPNYCEGVKNYTPNGGGSTACLQQLQYSLRLDEFASRKDILRHVQGILAKKRMIGRLLFPLRLSKRIIRRSMMLLTGR